MSISKWTEEEINILKNEYSKLSGNEIKNISQKLSLILNRTPRAIINKAYDLGITHREKYYTEEKIQFLKDNYDKMSMNDLAVILNKNESNIYRKMKELGLKKTKRIANTVNPKKTHQYSEEEKNKISESRKEWYKTHEHPKGYLGHTHSEETRKKLVQHSKEYWENITLDKLEERRIKQRITKIKNNTLNPMINRSNPYSRTRSGKRKDLNNIFFRSSWEANIARYFNYKGIEWQFEPKTFIFHTIKRGCVSYLPDFYLPKEDKWIEVKGWFDNKSKTKLKRFEKYYPEEYKKLQLITRKEYEKIQKEYSHLIKEWEY